MSRIINTTSRHLGEMGKIIRDELSAGAGRPVRIPAPPVIVDPVQPVVVAEPEPVPEPVVLLTDDMVNAISKEVSNVIAKAVVEHSPSCQSNINANKVVDLSGNAVGRDINIGGMQMATVRAIKLECIRPSDIANSIAKSVMDYIMSIFEKLDAGTKNKIVEKAQQVNETTNNTYGLQITNTNTAPLQNIVRNAINQTFDVNIVSHALQQLMLTPKNYGVRNAPMKVEQFVELMTKYMNEAGVGKNITTAIQSKIDSVETFASGSKRSCNCGDGSILFIFCVIVILLLVIYLLR